MESYTSLKHYFEQSSDFKLANGNGGMSLEQRSAQNQLPSLSPLPATSSPNKSELEFNFSMNPFASVHCQPKHTTFSENGDVHNLPKSMLQDQYGVAGLMVGRKLAAKGMAPYANGVHIADDLLDKPDLYEPLHERFGGPFHNTQLETDRQEQVLNPDYLVSSRMISENRVSGIDDLRRLWALRLDNCKEDVLFFLFYSFPKDALQLVAANHLYVKGWRYHTEYKIWMQRTNSYGFVSDGSREKGVYIYFDYRIWKLMRTECVVDLSKLEGPPNKPPEPGQQPQCFSRENA
ncbi:hypothetical protein Ocin01_12273 [Orchesella cincta]|uniref:NOT2/NOT3/NOT5 C-terminal domain-containing protein n=1 Tax=Orchesella cincta TaxID=48709 RepID=A0A1D2MMX3_ORCCI|nr:hypothetical protein Ocin01_12273 [Orchesella cincta]